MRHTLAIDIALIPKSQRLEQLVELSNQIELDGSTPKLDLSLEQRLPHITVGMAFVNEDVIPALIQIFDGCSFSAEISGSRKLIRDLTCTQYFDIELDSELKSLHNEVMEVLGELAQTSDNQRFAEDVEDSTRNYVRDFENYAGENYQPHITLGYGSSEPLKVLGKIDCELAIFHLGNHCTCHTRLT
jgi:hypothetical protein